MNQANETLTNSPSIDIKDVQGFFDVIEAAPTHSPKTMWDSIKIYVNGTDYFLYIYNFKNRTWYKSTLT